MIPPRAGLAGGKINVRSGTGRGGGTQFPLNCLYDTPAGRVGRRENTYALRDRPADGADAAAADGTAGVNDAVCFR